MPNIFSVTLSNGQTLSGELAADPKPSQSNTTINFALPTGKTVNKSLFGFSCSTYGGEFFSNQTFRNTANTYLKPALLAFNADWQLDWKYAAGDMGTINALLGNYKSFCQPDVRVVMGVCHKPTGGAGTRAGQAANFARWLNQNGHSNILDFHVGTLWDRESGWPQSTVIEYFTAVADALHAVNPIYRVWGPAQWDPGQFADATFANSVGSRCGGVDWVSYDCTGNGQGNVTDLANAYGPKGVQNPDALVQRSALSGSTLAHIPLGTFDYNMGEATVNGALTTVHQAGQYSGGIYVLCYLFGLWRSTTGVDACAMQNIVRYQTEGAIGNSQLNNDLTRVSCSGYILGKLGREFSGPEVACSTTLPRLVVWTTQPESSRFAMVLINYDTSNARTVVPDWGGKKPTGQVARWEIGKQGGTTPTPQSGTQADINSISVPSETVVLLTGALA